MIVKTLTTVKIEGIYVNVGSVIKVDDSLGKSLIESRSAVLVETDSEKKKKK